MILTKQIQYKPKESDILAYLDYQVKQALGIRPSLYDGNKRTKIKMKPIGRACDYLEHITGNRAQLVTLSCDTASTVDLYRTLSEYDGVEVYLVTRKPKEATCHKQ